MMSHDLTTADAKDAERWRFIRDNGLVWADHVFENNGACGHGRVAGDYAVAFVDQRARATLKQE